MGSFNTTCFASGQTIAPGDACYLLPIRRAHDYEKVDMTAAGEPFTVYGLADSTCYPHAFWRPIGDFIEAKYDDSGSFSLVETKMNGWRLTTLLQRFLLDKLDVAQGENSIHDKPFNLAAFITENLPRLDRMMIHPSAGTQEVALTDEQLSALFIELSQAWDYLMDAAHQHRLFAKHYAEPFDAQFAVIHAAAYDKLIAMSEAGKGWDGESFERRAYFDRAFAKLTAGMSAEQVQELDAAKSAGDSDEALFLERFQVTTQDSSFCEEFLRIGRLEGLEYPGYQQALRHVIRSYRKDGQTADQMFTRLSPFLDMQYVIASLNMLNVRITPMTYCSQDYDNEIGGKYADFVRKTEKAVTEGRREIYGEDEE